MLTNFFKNIVNDSSSAAHFAPESPRKQRIEYIDAMRGFTMILVVYSHVVTALFKTQADTNALFIVFRMPLFFFISGFFAYAVYNRSLVWKRSKNRVFKQFLPTVVMFTAFCLLFGFNYKYNIFHQQKRGYWFTFVAVEYFFTYMGINALSALLGKITKKISAKAWLGIFMTALTVGSFFFYESIKSGNPGAYTMINLFSLKLYALYLPFFFMGIAAKMVLPQFVRLLSNQWLAALIIVGFFVAYKFSLVDNSGRLIGALASALGVLMVFNIFRYYSNYFSHSTLVGRTLSIIGRYTLEIYLLHYFFIRSMISLRKVVPYQTIDTSWFLQLVVYMAFALAIIGMCMLVVRMLRVAPPLYRIAFGQLK